MISNRRSKILFITVITVVLFTAVLIQPYKEDKAIIATASSQEDENTPSPTQINSTRNYYFRNNHINSSLEESQDPVYDSIAPKIDPINNFQIVTDFGFNCSTGEPKDAIQEAIYSLPDERNEPVNIYLSGIFEPVSAITLEDNINFLASNATISGNEKGPIFQTNQTKQYSEVHTQFYLDETLMTDYVSLYNVTFKGIHFKNINTPSSFAIYGSEFNGTGWEILHNIQVIDCEFEGFTSAIYVNPRFSDFTNNYFHDNSNAGILLPYGYDLILDNNTFASRHLSILDNSTGLFRNPVGLYLFDVFGTCKVSNNQFIQDKSTIGIEFLSSQGEIAVFNNSFEGGEPFLIDAVERPFYSIGISFYSNIGVNDFSYNEGIFVYNNEP